MSAELRCVAYFASFSMRLLLLSCLIFNRSGSAFLFSIDETLEEPQKPVSVDETNEETSGRTPRRILVFGGNGFLGAETVERFVKFGDNVTIVNRGNWYWDSKNRIASRVQAISCDRKNGVESCEDLVQLVNDVDKFDAVIDFSAYGRREIADAVALLRGSSGSSKTSAKVAVYIHISTDSVYDVCDPDHRSPTGQAREIDAIRPSDPYLRKTLADHHEYANGKMEAEEELIQQRNPSSSTSANTGDDSTSTPIDAKPTGIPYVILRLPDVLGPRDTTYRFWFYQLWLNVAGVLSSRPVVVPQFLVGYNNSFVYVDDVARTVLDIVDRVAADGEPTAEKKTPIVDEVFNLGWPQNISLDGLLRDVESVLRDDDAERLKFHTEDNDNLYLYPTVRRGPIDSSKAVAALDWRPTDWLTAIRSTVGFYEAAMKDEKWRTQRDEIIQIVSGQLFSGTGELREEFYSTVEKIYDIDLAHFRPKRDEL